jgi:cytochrome b
MKQLIWDLPTRLFHWLLVISLFSAFGFAKVAEKETPAFYIHVVFAVLVMLLMVWRIFWGFAGSRNAQWRALVVSPQKALNYFKEVAAGRSSYYAGHNPGSSFVILIMMGLIGLILLSGVLVAQAEFLEEFHEIAPLILMGFVILHVGGVLKATKMNQQNYILAMFSGYKKAEAKDAIAKAHFLAAILMLIFIFGPWVYFIKGFDRNTAIFKAPGTQLSFQIGEPEVGNEDKDEGSK